MKKFIRNKDKQIQQSSKQNTSQKKAKSSPVRSQVFRNNEWVDPSSSSSSSSSDYSDQSDTQAENK